MDYYGVPVVYQYQSIQQPQQQPQQHPYLSSVNAIADARGTGNNPWGSSGTVKCEMCRTRRKRCEFDVSRPELPCSYCATNNLVGCYKVPAPNHGGSPPMSQSGSDTGLNLSTTYTRLSQFAAAYESQNPNATIQEVYQYLTSVVYQNMGQPSEPSSGYSVQSPNFWGMLS